MKALVVTLTLIVMIFMACSDPSIEPDDAAPLDAGVDSGRDHAVFDAYGYQKDHDVRNGIVDWGTQ